ncbi:SMU1112c/YaeR family gloxylase I-like metalloprotein [Sphingobacterium griseoflavum]|uniref:SMU1112c/YaeR family gloxylase I-like metalloprotein n=1 Tax=Sphingobacterium griseoflavum TaxID=1474952 RepID=UPI00167A3054|nr:VOC family protein [Sphingobacterium griseoflavum]
MSLSLKAVHHIAIICSDYKKSIAFYRDILGLALLSETYRPDRQSYKADLALEGRYIIELFSFPSPPSRLSYPEAVGLRHLAFTVDDVSETVNILTGRGVVCEPIRRDKQTGKRFFFTADPDGLPIEFYEC